MLTRRAFAALSACACIAPETAVAQANPGGKWVCPPCGCDHDGKVFDAPGTCPAPGCGMELVPQPEQTPAPAPSAPR